jgi:hypothetical protein
LIFSYVLGDNPLFRIGVYIFVGVSAGYIASVAFWQVLWSRLIYPLVNGSTPVMDKAFLAAPLLMAVLILMKVSPRLAGLGSIAMAFMVGVGAAVTIAGAVSGTLIPQVMGTINAFTIGSADASATAETILGGVIILAGAIFSLSYFHFGARPKADGSMRRLGLIELMAWIGRLFIGITLGAIFAGLYAAALTALIERINSLINFIGSFL